MKIRKLIYKEKRNHKKPEKWKTTKFTEKISSRTNSTKLHGLCLVTFTVAISRQSYFVLLGSFEDNVIT